MPTKTVAGRTWHFSHSIGHHVGAEGFTHPAPVTFDPDGVLYVADVAAAEGYGLAYGTPRIHKFTIDHDYIAEIGVGEVVWPEGLALDRAGNLYCSSAWDSQITVYTAEGERIARWGEAGSAPGQLNRPSGLAFDGDDNLLVVDGGNHRVQKFSADGRFLSAWGEPGHDEGQLWKPWGITIDPQGDVYVADWGNDRVQQFSSDGAFRRRFGSLIDDGGQLHRPSDVAIDSDGDVYVVDWGNHRVQVYYPDGDIITGLYGDARGFSKSGQAVMDVNPDYVRAFERVDPEEMIALSRFDRPRGIAIDGQDRIVVSDCTRGRLQVYVKDKDYVVPQFNL